MNGELKGYDNICCHPTCIANILSLNIVKKNFHVSYDFVTDASFIFQQSDRSKKVCSLK